MFTCPSADKDRPCLEMEGRFACYTLEFKSSLWSSGVLRRHNMAR